MTAENADFASRFARVVGAATAASTSKAGATTGAAMKAELGVYALGSAAAGLMVSAAGGPSYGTRMLLIAAGCMLGAFASAMLCEGTTKMQRAQRGFTSLSLGFLISLGVLAYFPQLKDVDNRDWLILVGGASSFLTWQMVKWAQDRGVVNATFDWLADRIGLKTNKRGKREKDEHEDGGP